MKKLFRTFSLIFFLSFAFSVIAQESDSVELHRPAKEPYFVIHTISVSGNYRTKKRIILRELTFQAGDTVLASMLDTRLLRAKYNIQNTLLFNFVRIDTIPYFKNQIDILIDLKERWYLFPIPTLDNAERNFNTWLENPNLARESYGFYFVDNNFKGLKSNLSFKFRFGYSEQFQVTYSIPYIDKKQASGLGFGFSYNRNHEIIYSTVDDYVQYYKNPESYVRDEWVGRINYSHRWGLYNYQLAELRFVKSSVSDSVVSLNKDYFENGSTIFQLFVASYGFRRDFRDSKIYPLKGYFVGIDFVKQGLGILKNESADLVYISASARKYWQLFDRTYFDAMLKGKLSTNDQPPYYVQRALGYGDYVRGYEYYVIDGQSFALLKTNIHYQLVRPNVHKFNGLGNEKFNTLPYAFYLSLFADAAYVSDKFYYQLNPLTNSWLIGGGVGLDFVTYYDIVLRFEYSVNRMGETGFYVHLSAPF